MQTSTSKTVWQAAAAVTAMATVGYAMALSGPVPAARITAASIRTVGVTAGRTAAPGARPSVPESAGITRIAPPPGRRAATRHQRQTPPRPHRPARQHPLVRREVGGRRLASRGIVVARRAMPLPPVPASAYVIANARTGQVLAAKDAHGLYPPASTLKVLTAITMLPRLRPNSTIMATSRAAAVVPNIVGLIPGHRYQVADLFRALLLISANDAAVSLVQASGSFSKGIALMNAEAHRLQAYDVVARQPNGLPAPGQVVSAYDLALIARRALAMPAFMRYDRTLSATFSATRFGQVPMVNENGLLTQYPGAIGGKIGWTMAAGATYIGMARRNGVTLIVTILHATPLTEIAAAEHLLNWGFAVNGRVRPVGTLVRPMTGP
ncbi:MAG TPA: D-alanyl-D-alanine carboxypeptidase [Streptosporangiaceae bacterium]|nr:D-alanyl-D-alanine carboxypeptidase [Streptosporangiaceae bacterium]